MHEEPCLRCNGQGTIVCDVCHGKKKISREMVAEKCKACSGTGRIKCPANCRGGVVWVKE
jgi:DnaJ-class molecular chaperone